MIHALVLSSQAKADQALRAVASVFASELSVVEGQAAREEAATRTLHNVRRVSVLVEMRAKTELALLCDEVELQERGSRALQTKLEVRGMTIFMQKGEIEALQQQLAEETRRADAEQLRADRAEAALSAALEKIKQKEAEIAALKAWAEEQIVALEQKVAALAERLRQEKAEAARARKEQAKAELLRAAAEARSEATRRKNAALRG